MQIVRDDEGRQYLLLKRSSESSRVRDPETGNERYLPNDAFEVVDGESPLVAAASGVPESVRRVLSATHGDRSLGLLVELADGGPLSIIELLDSYDLCESDLHGQITEFRTAGLVEEAQSYGERGYDATELARDGVAKLRGE
ncbi:DUF7346 family protein [Haloprofundus salilacus]|uniref:DUF7346 family protein n=1 Tax=Haloprofundus salilacus TaxID=2876190 RepID=UPI001CCF4F55|nr:hypothetical protein [Haloprofundus salilacus]